MILSVIRLAVRHAIDLADTAAAGTTCRQDDAVKVKAIEIRLQGVDPIVVEAGLPLDTSFMQRAKIAMEEDLKLIKRSTSTPEIHIIA
jgi:uncharacterized protein YbjT (DUF2867 family)